MGEKQSKLDNLTKHQNSAKNSDQSPNEIFKIEAAAELGLLERAKLYGWDTLTAQETGKLGALIKKKLAKTAQRHASK
jgi:small acid-soluble spore protein F (minor alpha/beta-type SASP)